MLVKRFGKCTKLSDPFCVHVAVASGGVHVAVGIAPWREDLRNVLELEQTVKECGWVFGRRSIKTRIGKDYIQFLNKIELFRVNNTFKI